MATIKQQLNSWQIAILEKIDRLQQQMEFNKACAKRFSEVESVISEALSKLHLELVDIRLMTCNGFEDGKYSAQVIARSVQGFRYFEINSSNAKDYVRLQNRAEKCRKTLFDALTSYRPYHITFNPYLFVGGSIGDTMNIIVELK